MPIVIHSEMLSVKMEYKGSTKSDDTMSSNNILYNVAD